MAKNYTEDRNALTRRNATLFDIADALGISTGTVHRALHNHPGVSAATRSRVLQVSKSLGYRPNLAARFLSQRKRFRISVNTLSGTTSFWDEVRDGINQGARALGVENVELDFRTYPLLGEAEEEAFVSATRAESNGIIAFPSRPKNFREWTKRAAKSQMPVVCVSTDAPDSGRLAVISTDTMASGSLAADLIGKFAGHRGKVAATLSALSINEHAEKFEAFRTTVKSLHPEMQVLEPIEDHDTESEAYDKCRALFLANPDLAGLYITTEASIPVIQAAKDADMLGRLSVITTDLFPKLAEELGAGNVAATIYQRPRTQGRLAFQVLYNYLADGRTPPRAQVTLVPHLVMRGNLEYFLARHPMGVRATAEAGEESSELATFD